MTEPAERHCRTCICCAPPAVEVISREPGGAVVSFHGRPFRFTWTGATEHQPGSARWAKSPTGRWELVFPGGQAAMTVEPQR
jgi:hypothetical protein